MVLSGHTSAEKIFESFPYHIALCKTSDPWNGVNTDQCGIIWTVFVEMMLHIKYESSELYSFGQIFLKVFLAI